MSTSLEPGAPPPRDTIPLCVPEIRGNEWNYIKECLDTNFVSSVGPFVDRFERELAAYVEVRHAVSTVNGTAALHIALIVAGVKAEDEVIVPSLTFIAPANAVRYVGAWPLFIDVDPQYGELHITKLEEFLRTECRQDTGCLTNIKTGRRIAALMPVHVLGHPVDMDPLLDLGRKYNLPVIEDATESLGARYKGKKTGGIGHVGCFSFNGNKLLTTGGGGMLVTNNPEWAARAKYLTTQAKDNPIEYVHNNVGYNYRLTNVLAALGVAQLEKVDEFIAAKRRIAKRYGEALGRIAGITIMPQAEWAESIFWMYTIKVDAGSFGMDSRELLTDLGARKVQARPLWQPLHMSPAHAESPRGDCSHAEALYKDCLSIPCSVGLTTEQQEFVISSIERAHSSRISKLREKV